MKKRPIIFSGPMIRAIIEGRKTVTRRPMKPQPTPEVTNPALRRKCPYGVPGDELWVKESHFLFGKWVRNGKTKTGKQAWRFKRLNDEVMFLDAPPVFVYTRKTHGTQEGWFKRSSLFMRRRDSRIQLIVKSVRAERLHDITDTDIFAEGTEYAVAKGHQMPARVAFQMLWRRLYSKKPKLSWDANPWVWRVEFERKPNAT